MTRVRFTAVLGAAFLLGAGVLYVLALGDLAGGPPYQDPPPQLEHEQEAQWAVADRSYASGVWKMRVSEILAAVALVALAYGVWTWVKRRRAARSASTSSSL